MTRLQFILTLLAMPFTGLSRQRRAERLKITVRGARWDVILPSDTVRVEGVPMTTNFRLYWDDATNTVRVQQNARG